MTEFENFIACLLIPVAYVLTYIAGKYNLLHIICKMLEERVEKYNENKKEGGSYD